MINEKKMLYPRYLELNYSESWAKRGKGEDIWTII